MALAAADAILPPLQAWLNYIKRYFKNTATLIILAV